MRLSLITDEKILAEFAKRIDLRRREKGFTEKDLGIRSGTSLSTIRRIQTSQGSVTLLNFIKVLRALDELDYINDLLSPDRTFRPSENNYEKPKKRIHKRKINTNFKWGES